MKTRIDWVHLLMPEIEKVCPTATHGWDFDGQLVVYTGMYATDHEDQLSDEFPNSGIEEVFDEDV